MDERNLPFRALERVGRAHDEALARFAVSEPDRVVGSFSAAALYKSHSGVDWDRQSTARDAWAMDDEVERGFDGGIAIGKYGD